MALITAKTRIEADISCDRYIAVAFDSVEFIAARMAVEGLLQVTLAAQEEV